MPGIKDLGWSSTIIADEYGDVSRDDVAATLVKIIARPVVNRIIIELIQGDTAVGETVQLLAHTRPERLL